MTLNAHRVFENSGAVESYHRAISVDSAQQEELRKARDKIRESLREGLRDWTPHVLRKNLFENMPQAIEPPPLRPKFHMQGSFSYRTQIHPAHLPPQEMDLDDGMFLPVSFITDNGKTHPVIASRGLFQAAKSILGLLCNRENWILVTDKASCVRVEVSETAHVDVALYAIPDSKFEQLLDEAVIKANVKRGVVGDAIDFDEGMYRRLRRGQENQRT
jgi:hypothetical protein